MEALIAGSGTLLVVMGYMIVKKIGRSRCAVDSGCIECESPAIELQKKQTERLDDLYDIIKQIERRVPPAVLREGHFVNNVATTTEVRKVDDNSAACLAYHPREHGENHTLELGEL